MENKFVCVSNKLKSSVSKTFYLTHIHVTYILFSYSTVVAQTLLTDYECVVLFTLRLTVLEKKTKSKLIWGSNTDKKKNTAKLKIILYITLYALLLYMFYILLYMYTP